jgi:hypothetical protein
MNKVIEAFAKIISGEAKITDFNINIKDCIEGAKELGIKEFDAKILNEDFRNLAFNEIYKNI